jgi:hypothetical protein
VRSRDKAPITRGLLLLQRTRRKIYSFFDQNDAVQASHFLDRHNIVLLKTYPGEKPRTLGNMLDEYLECRAFEGRL